jgi:hypothetical protein
MIVLSTGASGTLPLYAALTLPLLVDATSNPGAIISKFSYADQVQCDNR